MKIEYKAPCMKVIVILPTVFLSTSDEQNLRKFDDEDMEELGEDYSQW